MEIYVSLCSTAARVVSGTGLGEQLPVIPWKAEYMGMESVAPGEMGAKVLTAAQCVLPVIGCTRQDATRR